MSWAQAPQTLAIAAAALLIGACGSEPAPAPKAQAETSPEAEAKAEPATDPEAAPAPVEDPNAPPAICRRALACASACYREAHAPKQSLPECEVPGSAACAAALQAAAPPDLAMTLAAVQCVLKCEPEHRTRQDLKGVDLAQWAQLSVEERAAWAGISVGRDCVPGAACERACAGPDFEAPVPVQKRSAAAKVEAAQAEGAAAPTGEAQLKP